MGGWTKAFAVAVLLAALPAQAAPTSREAATAAAFDRIAGNPALLRIFLQAMPKGGDLHNHLSGAIYAEDFLAWAAEAKLCITPDNSITDPVVGKPCEPVPAGLTDPAYDRYAAAIDALSMRGVRKDDGGTRDGGADRFFATFSKFSAAGYGKGGAMLAAAREAAADDHVLYLETMLNPSKPAALGQAAATASFDGSDFAAMDAAMQDGLDKAVAAARTEMDGVEAEANRMQDCSGTRPTPGCAVLVRYQGFAVRNLAPAQVYAGLAFAVALAVADPRFVGVNIVAPEHHPVALRDYGLHMRMLAWLKAHHPGVKLALHAGELTLGLVPPRDLRFHIHDAVTVASADRIGHGVDIPYETDAAALLKQMAARKIAVEINLTSNAVILGVKGKDHPLVAYRAAGVPVVLSTDDEGVSRSDMTNEYMRAVTEQGLRYRDLKQMARNSIAYSFLSPADKAKAKTALEKQFAQFEAALPVVGK